MKKGFTLMEMLAVILVLAVVVSMAVPVFRSVRYEVKNSQAKAAAKKLAEAMRSYYQVSRGGGVTQECFGPWSERGSGVIKTDPSKCVSVAAEGIPRQSTGSSGVEQLFACGYVSYKDFVGLPYDFCICDPVTASSSSQSNTGCRISDTVNQGLFVVAWGTEYSGDKFKGTGFAEGDYHLYVDRTMQVRDNLE